MMSNQDTAAPVPSARRRARPSAIFTALALLPRLARVACFGACVGIVVLLLAARAGAVQIRGELLSLGREMMRYGPPGQAREARQLEFNGTALGVVTGFTTDAVTVVLDEYARRCESRDGSSGASPVAPQPATESRTPRTTFRQDEGSRGFVACLDVGGIVRSPMETLQRVRAAASTGDLREVGGLRYLYAERSSSGRTRFVALWSDGEMNVRRMFPATGDAPGEDPRGVPRAAGLRRVIDAHEVGGQQALWVFSGRVDRSAVERHYRDSLAASGWTLSPVADRGPERPTLLAFDRDGISASVAIDGADAGDTHVTVFLSH